MRPLIFTALIFLAPPMALAQQEAPETLPEQEQEQPSRPIMPFLEDWAERTESLMRELMEEIGPEMEQFVTRMLPELQRLAERLGGLRHYQAPEMLPNGDIIIRRKPDAPPLPEDFLEPEDPVEL